MRKIVLAFFLIPVFFIAGCTHPKCASCNCPARDCPCQPNRIESCPQVNQ